MSWCRRRSAFLLGWIEADQRHRDCPDRGDGGVRIAGCLGDRGLGGESKIPFDRLIGHDDLAAGLIESVIVENQSGRWAANEGAGVVRDVEARLLREGAERIPIRTVN
jgi:hypothetical protein